MNPGRKSFNPCSFYPIKKKQKKTCIPSDIVLKLDVKSMCIYVQGNDGAILSGTLCCPEGLRPPGALFKSAACVWPEQDLNSQSCCVETLLRELFCITFTSKLLNKCVLGSQLTWQRGLLEVASTQSVSRAEGKPAKEAWRWICKIKAKSFEQFY